MAHGRGSVLLAVPVLVLSLFLVGCPKRPATTAASAPPPTGAPAAAAAAPSTAPGMAPSGAAPVTAAPSTTPPRPSEFQPTENLKDIFFDFDKYNIRSGDAKTLDTNAAWLKSNNDLVLIEGHCDERGTNEYNLALGERRAKATMNYLVAQGVQASRITIISYGKERPTCTEHNESCWAKNRRSHFLVKAR